MNAALTPDQRQVLACAKEGCLRLTDPETNENYVLIKAEVYDRFQYLSTEDTVLTTVTSLIGSWPTMTCMIRNCWNGKGSMGEFRDEPPRRCRNRSFSLRHLWHLC